MKLLVWYRPDAEPDVLAHQQANVRQVGQDCRCHDIAFILELPTHPFKGEPDAQQPAQTTERGAQNIIDSLEEFAKPDYGVDLFKLESPLPGPTLSAPDGSTPHHDAQNWFDEMGRICREAAVPWVVLSAGVTPVQFLRAMQYAYSAGAKGFLAGRTIWSDALTRFPDLTACREVLRGQGMHTQNSLLELTPEAGHAWAPDYSGLGFIKAEGDMCAR